MEVIKIKCENCQSQLDVVEESLMFSGDKVTERVFCPHCKNEVYSGETDGWFAILSQSEKTDAECVFPMS